MSTRPFVDIVALAKRINRLREEYNNSQDAFAVKITPAMSRILENDPDYVPYRRRKDKRRGPVKNPTIGSLVEIAALLDTTVGELLGEPPTRPFSPTNRERVKVFLRYVADKL